MCPPFPRIVAILFLVSGSLVCAGAATGTASFVEGALVRAQGGPQARRQKRGCGDLFRCRRELGGEEMDHAVHDARCGATRRQPTGRLAMIRVCIASSIRAIIPGGIPRRTSMPPHDFRNVTDCGPGPWDNPSYDIPPSHEIGHIVEGASNGVHGSPAFGL